MADEYVVQRDFQTGKVSGVIRKIGNGGISFGPQSSEWPAFLDWNAQQSVPLSLADIVPGPAVIDPDLVLAVQILKAVPDSWKNDGNNSHAISWATKRVFKEIRQELLN